MRITKTKTYSQFSLDEIKEDLRIAASTNKYNGELTRLIRQAVAIAEQYTGIDVVPTTNTLEDYDIACNTYQLDAPNITVTSVLTDGNAVSGYTSKYFQQSTTLKFSTAISCEVLTINYSSGFSNIPPDIMKAISIKIGELFEGDRNGYVSGSVKETKAFERILFNHKQLIY